MSDADEGVTSELNGDDVKHRALKVRIRRMRHSIGLQVVLATIFEQFIRSIMTGNSGSGTNLVLFGLLGLCVHYFFKYQMTKMDSSSAAWTGKSPWLVPFWIGALFITCLSAFRFL